MVDTDGHRFDLIWGTRGVGEGQFNRPSDIVVGSDGALYVTDTHNNRIQCFDADGRFLRQWGNAGITDGAFQGPRGAAIATMDCIFASIVRALAAVPALSAFPPGVLPLCASYVGAEWLYVIDCFNDRVQLFDCAGTFLKKWGAKGDDDAQFNDPSFCAVDDGGLVYVSDTQNNRVQVFLHDGTVVNKWGLNGCNEGRVMFPAGIAVSRGIVYVADYNNDCIQCFQSNGTFIHKLGRSDGPRGGPGRLCLPYGLKFDDGSLWVADNGNNRIQQFRTEGTFLREWSGDEFFCPESMALGKNGCLYIVDHNVHKILRMRVR